MEEKHQQEEEVRWGNPLQHGRSNPDSDYNDEDEHVSTTKGHGFNPQLPGNIMALMDEQRIKPSVDASINAADVLCGRGKMSFNHVGNKRFRDAVTHALEDYMRAETRFEKSLVVQCIVDNIHAAGGRFMKKDFREGRWYELSKQHTKEKAGHAIRDAANLCESSRQKKEQDAERRMSGDFSASGGTSRGSAVSRKPSYAALSSSAAMPSHHRDYYSKSSPTLTPAGAERHGTYSVSYEPQQRKRRRTASPPLMHLSALEEEEALSAAPVLAACLPRSLKRSPIFVNPPSALPSHHHRDYYSESSPTLTPSGAKRHGTSSVSYEPQHQRKRRRTASPTPLHLPAAAEEALSAAPVLAASLPRSLKRSPIMNPPPLHRQQQPPPHMRHSRGSVATAQQLHPPLTEDPVASAGSMTASLPRALRRSPIEQQQQQRHLRQQEQHQQQHQQHIPPLPLQPQLPHRQQRWGSSYSTF